MPVAAAVPKAIGKFRHLFVAVGTSLRLCWPEVGALCTAGVIASSMAIFPIFYLVLFWSHRKIRGGQLCRREIKISVRSPGQNKITTLPANVTGSPLSVFRKLVQRGSSLQLAVYPLNQYFLWWAGKGNCVRNFGRSVKVKAALVRIFTRPPPSPRDLCLEN